MKAAGKVRMSGKFEHGRTILNHLVLINNGKPLDKRVTFYHM